jgi:hypothetical protein
MVLYINTYLFKLLNTLSRRDSEAGEPHNTSKLFFIPRRPLMQEVSTSFISVQKSISGFLFDEINLF